MKLGEFLWILRLLFASTVHQTQKAGSSECLRCGRNTESNKNKDRCLTMGCKFSPQKNVVYDLNMLSRPGGPMHQVLFRRPARRSRRLSILPSSTFYVNLCSLNHTNRSCTELDLDRRIRIPIPTMACMSGWYSIRDVDIGNVIGYVKKKDITSGLTVELLHGDRRCWDRRRAKYTRYNTTIDMVCDTSAGVGQPMFNRTSFYPRPSGCTHKLVWKSLYACPKCQKEFFRRVVSYCMNGVKDVRYVKTTPCWGIPEGIPKIPVETELCNETTNSTGLPTVVVTETVVVNRTDDNHVAAHVVMTSNVNMVLIGVGVAIVVTLTVVAVFFFYKHRKLQYRYLSMATRNKPMSRLEEEEEDLAHLDGSPHARMM